MRSGQITPDQYRAERRGARQAYRGEARQDRREYRQNRGSAPRFNGYRGGGRGGGGNPYEGIRTPK